MPLRALAIADDDSLVGNLDLGPIDILLCLGDLWVSSLEKAHGKYSPKATFGVKGNHDSDAPFPSFIKPLHGTIEHFGGLSFGGFNGSWRYKPRGHHLFDQDEVTRSLESFPRVDVFIAHNSPSGVHERDDHVHQGFEAFLTYIETAKPRYLIHGHQHLRQTTMIGETRVIGVFGEEVIEIE